MAARNLLSAEVLIRLSNVPDASPIGVELTVPARDNPKRETLLSYTKRRGKRTLTLRIPVELSRFWMVVRGSDADVRLIRSHGYALTDGRDA